LFSLFIFNNSFFFYIISGHYSNKKFKRKSRILHFIKNLYQAYHSLCFIFILIIRLFAFIDKITREIFLFIEKVAQIIRVVYGWIQLIRTICSVIHLFISRLMLLSYYLHRIFHLLTILFEPLSNRTFEKSVRNFSHFLFYYYSSNGACYTLQARTRHIVERVRARWKRKYICINQDDDDDIYYDAFGEENEWY
jgi:hypothetical protein